MPGLRSKIQLLARSPLSGRAHRLRFAACAPFQWAAGQHLVVVRGQGQDLFLPYSIASAYDAQKPGEFELAVLYNAGAQVMDELLVGEQLEVEGPAGELTWQVEPSPAALLVGVGTGIAPLRALIEAELARATAVRLLLIAGHRAPEDVLFQTDFADLAAQHTRFRFLPTLSGASEAWQGERGRVQAQLRGAVHALGALDAYVCGRADMVREVSAQLLREGVPAARVRAEGY